MRLCCGMRDLSREAAARALEELAESTGETIARIAARGDRIDHIQNETRALLNANQRAGRAHGDPGYREACVDAGRARAAIENGSAVRKKTINKPPKLPCPEHAI